MIPSRWSWNGETRYALAFGSLLGAGLFTKVSFIGYHLLLSMCLLGQSAVWAALVMALFGFARTAPVFLFPLAALMKHACFDARPASRSVRAVLAVDRATAFLRLPAVVAVAIVALVTA